MTYYNDCINDTSMAYQSGSPPLAMPHLWACQHLMMMDLRTKNGVKWSLKQSSIFIPQVEKFLQTKAKTCENITG